MKLSFCISHRVEASWYIFRLTAGVILRAKSMLWIQVLGFQLPLCALLRMERVKEVF